MSYERDARLSLMCGTACCSLSVLLVPLIMMRVLAFITALLPWMIAGQLNCSDSANVVLGKGFYFVQVSLLDDQTWTGAQQTCQSLLPGEAGLAVLKDDADFELVQTILDTSSSYWIGLSLINSQYPPYWGWQWIDQTNDSMDFHHWAAGEPVSSSQFQSRCASLLSNSGIWGAQSLQCTDASNSAICSIPSMCMFSLPFL
jgi:hypothetical protein